MRRDPHIISLYDKPLYRREHLITCRPRDRDNYGAVLAAFAAITMLTTGFFLIYDALAHREPPYVPEISAAYPLSQRFVTHEDAPSPDMGSPAIEFANADVVDENRTEISVTQTQFANPTRLAKAQPRKNPKPHVAKARTIRREAAQAYASGPAFWQVPLGRF